VSRCEERKGGTQSAFARPRKLMTKLGSKYSRLTFCDKATRVRLVRPLQRRPGQSLVPTHRRSVRNLPAGYSQGRCWWAEPVSAHEC